MMPEAAYTSTRYCVRGPRNDGANNRPAAVRTAPTSPEPPETPATVQVRTIL